MAFVNYMKAFNSWNHKFIIKALINLATPNIIIIWKEITLKLKKGAKWDDPLSPIILVFKSALEEIINKLDWENKGIKMTEKYLSNLCFADDLVLISNKLK